jgi:DNA-binding CsgD family transcriptional regulator
MRKEDTIHLIERGESWKESDEVVELNVKSPLEKVIPIRLSADDWSRLREEAKELGIGPTTLARMWIMERLKQSNRSIDTTLRFSILNSMPFPQGFVSALNSQELDILKLIAQQLTVTEISNRLKISQEKIKEEILVIYQKLVEQQKNNNIQKLYQASGVAETKEEGPDQPNYQ